MFTSFGKMQILEKACDSIAINRNDNHPEGIQNL